LLGDILQDGRILGEHGSVVEPQRRHVAKRVDSAIVLACRQSASGVSVDFDKIDGRAGFGERADIEQASGAK
jgi:hypothetical protein